MSISRKKKKRGKRAIASFRFKTANCQNGRIRRKLKTKKIKNSDTIDRGLPSNGYGENDNRIAIAKPIMFCNFFSYPFMFLLTSCPCNFGAGICSALAAPAFKRHGAVVLCLVSYCLAIHSYTAGDHHHGQ
jgi:hypothetical protein